MRRHCRSLVSVNFNPFHARKESKDDATDGWMDQLPVAKPIERFNLTYSDN